jgi:RHS repeat-associated protein
MPTKLRTPQFHFRLALMALVIFLPFMVYGFDQPFCSSCQGITMDAKNGSGGDNKIEFEGFYTNTPPVPAYYLQDDIIVMATFHHSVTPSQTWDSTELLTQSYVYDEATHALISSNETATYTTNGVTADEAGYNRYYLSSPNELNDETVYYGFEPDPTPTPTDTYELIDNYDTPDEGDGVWGYEHHTNYMEHLSHEYLTSDMENKASGLAAAALGTNQWQSNAPSANGGANLAANETACNMSHGQYRFRLYTDTDVRYVVTWPIHMSISGPGTNYSEPEPTTGSWTVDGDGNEQTSPTYDLAQSFPSDGQSVSMWVMASEVCVQAFPINSGGGGGGGGGGDGGGGGGIGGGGGGGGGGGAGGGGGPGAGAGGGGGCNGSCGGPNALAGSPSTSPSISSGPQLQLSLGDNSSGFPVGSILINPSQPAQATPPLAQLQAFSGDYSTGAAAGMSQFASSQALFNVVSNSPSQFEIDVYATNNFSGTLSGGMFPFTTNSQYVTWLIENPGGASDTNDLQITEIRGGYGITNLFTWSTDGNSLTLIAGNGLRKEVWSKSWNSDLTERTETREIRYTNDAQVYVKTQTYDVFSWGEGLVSSVEGSGATARTTSYSYDGSGRISEVDNPDGTSMSYTYDGYGRISENDWPNHKTAFDYTPLGGGDDGSFESNRVRTVMNYLNGNLISGHYSIITSNYTIEIQAGDTSGLWNSSANLFTTNNLDTNGRVSSVVNPDKTMKWFSYAITSTNRTNTVYSGYPVGGGAYVTNIIEVISLGLNGRILSDATTEDGILTSQTLYTNYDSLGRVGQINYLDQTSVGYGYDCCAISSMTNRDGLATDYTYDDLKRRHTATTHGLPGAITWFYNYDPAGHLLSTVREGTDGSQITNFCSAFDNAGLQTNSVGALSNTNTFSYALDGYGHWVTSATHPDGGTDIKTYNSDGSLLSRTGTAVRPSSFDYESDGSGNSYITETKLDASESPTAENVTTYTDMLGQTFKTVYASASGTPTQISYFNTLGQLTNTIDPDGVSTIYAYNAKGERAYTILDMNQNGAIDWSGPDRITYTTNDVVVAGADNARRTLTYVWSASSNSSNRLSTVLTSTDGLKQWNIAWNNSVSLINLIQTAYGSSGYRYVTNTAPDGSFFLSTYQYGMLLSVVRKDSSGTQLSSTTYTYDPHGRQNTATDARNGTTTYYFNNADQVSSIVTPSPGGGGSVQTTTNAFDSMGRITATTQPDGTAVNNLYYPTGDLALTYGSRIYPAGYSYDAQGRMATMTNWSDFSEHSGTRVTSWTYDAYRGFLAGKTYDGGTQGPSYTYTAAGRLASRLWARGTNTAYSYDNAGGLATVIYNDGSTPGVTNGYDRRGRLTTVSNGPTVCNLTYNDQNQALGESYSGGPLNGLTVSNIYDSFLRRTTNGLWNGTTWLTQTRYAYDAASRLSSVSDGTNTAGYSYVANSSLVSQISFTNVSSLRMTTSKNYDYLNRLTSISNANASSVVLDSHSYAYNNANERTSATNTDGTYWIYQYDSLGQVISGVKYWPDNSVVAGQQFGYGFDDIGNRTGTSVGGDQWGANLRYANYTANPLNQYTSRTVPGAVDIIGAATNTATVTVNNEPTYRKGTYFRAQLSVNNSSGADYDSVTNLAVLNRGGTNQDILTNITGNIFLPQNPENFVYDADGNLTQDGRWTYSWDGENRLINMTSLSTAPANSKLMLDFIYDWKSRRIQKQALTNNSGTYTTSYTTDFAYDGWSLISEINDATSALTRNYIWGIDLSGSMQEAGGIGGLLALYNSGIAQFVCFDGNGNVSALAGLTGGTVAAEYEYGPFGEVLYATGPMPKANPFGFSTKYQDNESDLLYYGYRFLNTSTGRWLSRDPNTEGGFELIRNKPRSLHPMEDRVYRIIADLAQTNPTLAKTMRVLAPLVNWQSLESLNDGAEATHIPDAYAFVCNSPISSHDLVGLTPSWGRPPPPPPGSHKYGCKVHCDLRPESAVLWATADKECPKDTKCCDEAANVFCGLLPVPPVPGDYLAAVTLAQHDYKRCIKHFSR